jgi:hypothetical protein
LLFRKWRLGTHLADVGRYSSACSRASLRRNRRPASIDHIGWRSTGTLAKTIDNLRGQGVTILTEPRPLALKSGPGINFSYVSGPAGVKIEIVERPGLKPGE